MTRKLRVRFKQKSELMSTRLAQNTYSAKLVKLTIFYFNSSIKLLTPKKDKKKLLRDFEMMSMFKFIED